MVILINNIKKVFLCFAIFGSVQVVAMAQSTQIIEEEIYFNQELFLQKLEDETARIINCEKDYLNVENAISQLKETVGKQARIKKIPLRNKTVDTAKLANLVKQSAVIFGAAFDCGNCNRMHINVASGYVIDESGIIVTNHHVVEAFTQAIKGTNIAMPIQTVDGKVYLVKEILACDEQADLCIVRVDTRGDKLKALPLGTAALQGDQVFMMGHPDDMLFYFTQGIVARNYMGPRDSKRTQILPRMDITADYSAGASGGAIVDSKGNLVATVSSTYSIYAKKIEKENLQMVVKKTMPVILLKNMIELI